MFCRGLIRGVAGRGLCCSGALLLLQLSVAAQKIDYNQEQYDAYLSAVNEKDLSLKEDKLLAFVRANPGLSLAKYALGQYDGLLTQYNQQGQYKKVISAGAKLLELQPESAHLVQFLCQAAYAGQLYRDAVKYGETAYRNSPSASLAFILANSYYKLKDNQNFAVYGPKAVQELKPEQAVEISGWLRALYVQKEDWAKASVYARKTLQGLAAIQKPEQLTDAQWASYVNGEKAVSRAVMGRASYERGRWAESISHFGRLLRMKTTRNLKGEAYYYIGLANWKQEKLNPAMEAFARGAALSGVPHAAPCGKYLETLYRSSHNGSDAGLREFKKRFSGGV